MPNKLSPWRVALLAVLMAAMPVFAHAQSQALEDLARFPQETLAIKTKRTTHVFQIWVADTPSRKAQGLMFVRGLAADRGMLFVHDTPRVASMWMKNTYIPLDMVFVGANGKVAEVHANTTPHSLELVTSRKPVLAVLELAAGEAARRGIQPGDRVIHPAFGTAPVRRKDATKKP